MVSFYRKTWLTHNSALVFLSTARHSSAKLLLGYLGPIRLPFLWYSAKLPVCLWSCWTPGQWTGRLTCQNQSNTFLRRCTQSARPFHCKITLTRYSTWSEFFPTILSFARYSPFPKRNCPDFAATVTAFFWQLLFMQDKTGTRVLCSSCGNQLQDLTHLLLYNPNLSLSVVLSLALFLSFFISGPVCWVSTEFFHDSIQRKGSDSITTRSIRRIFVAALAIKITHCRISQRWSLIWLSCIGLLRPIILDPFDLDLDSDPAELSV